MTIGPPLNAPHGAPPAELPLPPNGPSAPPPYYAPARRRGLRGSIVGRRRRWLRRWLSQEFSPGREAGFRGASCAGATTTARGAQPGSSPSQNMRRLEG